MAEMSFFEQMKSILDTFGASLKDRRVLATAEEVEARAAICRPCEKLREKRGRYSCVVCGCAFHRKIAYSGSSCPLKKW
jgi:hypothetical protein